MTRIARDNFAPFFFLLVAFCIIASPQVVKAIKPVTVSDPVMATHFREFQTSTKRIVAFDGEIFDTAHNNQTATCVTCYEQTTLYFPGHTELEKHDMRQSSVVNGKSTTTRSSWIRQYPQMVDADTGTTVSIYVCSVCVYEYSDKSVDVIAGAPITTVKTYAEDGTEIPSPASTATAHYTLWRFRPDGKVVTVPLDGKSPVFEQAFEEGFALFHHDPIGWLRQLVKKGADVYTTTHLSVSDLEGSTDVIVEGWTEGTCSAPTRSVFTVWKRRNAKLPYEKDTFVLDKEETEKQGKR